MSNTRPPFDSHKTPRHHENALLRLLVDEAIRRGDTLQSLAKHLGVSYTRLTQWRRKAALMKNAHRSVHTQAALYLDLPVVVVLVLAGVITLPDFGWPGKATIESELARALGDMQQDSLIAGLVPSELASASQALREFVAFLYLELRQAQFNQQQTSLRLSIIELAEKKSEAMLSASTKMHGHFE